jgi:hypothetical protein
MNYIIITPAKIETQDVQGNADTFVVEKFDTLDKAYAIWIKRYMGIGKIYEEVENVSVIRK